MVHLSPVIQVERGHKPIFGLVKGMRGSEFSPATTYDGAPAAPQTACTSHVCSHRSWEL